MQQRTARAASGDRGQLARVGGAVRRLLPRRRARERRIRSGLDGSPTTDVRPPRVHAARLEAVVTSRSVHFYDDLADWWPLFSPPEHYVEEADDLLPRIRRIAPHARTLLELGSGGGSLAFHL